MKKKSNKKIIKKTSTFNHKYDEKYDKLKTAIYNEYKSFIYQLLFLVFSLCIIMSIALYVLTINKNLLASFFLLAIIPIFAFCTLNKITKKYKKGAPVYLAGTPVTDIGIVLYGTVQIENNDLWGNKNIISLAHTGEVFAEAYACVPGEPMMVDVIAMEEAEILFLNVPELFRLSAAGKGEYSHLIHNMTIISARKNLLLSRRILHTSSKKIRDRLLSYLSYQAGLQKNRYIDIPLNRQQLADYLSLDRSALSKELSKMKKEGLLDYHKNSFVLKDIE